MVSRIIPAIYSKKRLATAPTKAAQNGATLNEEEKGEEE